MGFVFNLKMNLWIRFGFYGLALNWKFFQDW